MNVLVTGGAGYIGSVTVEALRQRGDTVGVIDNLSTGNAGALNPKLPFFHADIRDTVRLVEVFQEFQAEAVIHFAAFSLVGESVTHPAKYMDNNVGGTLSLLQAMKLAGVKKLVFSSTAATYGEPRAEVIDESHPTEPKNPYGLTKRFMEQAMQSYSEAYGLCFAALRYFNACGAIPERGEAHRPETHLVPLILQVALGQREHISIFGSDYDTPDGTCIRDYIHVADLADAHLRALDYLGENRSLICNLGNGEGFSVREVIDTCRTVTGHEIPAKEVERRAGDPSRLVANAGLAHERLGWQPKCPELKTIVTDAWKWHQAHPNGYANQA